MTLAARALAIFVVGVVTGWAAPANAAKRQVVALLCPSLHNRLAADEASELLAAIDALFERLAGEDDLLAVSLVRGRERGACETIERMIPLDGETAPNLVVGVRRIGEAELAVVQVRIAYRIPAPDVDFTIYGRRFSGALAEKQIILSANERDADVRFVEGLARTLLHREAIRSDDEIVAAARAGLDRNRAAALRAWQGLDDEAAAVRAPVSAALAKQLKALLLLDVPCPSETPGELFRAAARLLPHDDDARVLAALARLKDAYEPQRCARTAEAELVDSIELNPWGHVGAENLAVLYELSANANPGGDPTRHVPALEARERLGTIWQGRAPGSPKGIEFGMLGGLYVGGSAAASEEWLRALAPGGRVEGSHGPDGQGAGVRLSISLPWARGTPITERGLGTGDRAQASWWRLALGVGGFYRWGFDDWYGEVGGAVLGASLIAKGQDFSGGDGFDWGIDVGGELDLRVGRRFGRMSLFLALVSTHYPTWLDGAPDTLQAVNGQSVAIPTFDIAALFGASVFAWR